MMCRKDIFVFFDVEGPCTLNDIAYEITVALAELSGLGEEIGRRFYENISNIDDIWGDYKKLLFVDPDYSSGHTLKVILPFWKAMGANLNWFYKFSRENLRLVPHIKRVLTTLSKRYNVWFISTSHDFFIKAFCDEVGFDFSRAYCTKVENFDEIKITESEKDLLIDFMKEVARMPLIEYDKETGEVDPKHRANYNRITDFIWEEIHNFEVGEFLKTVHPVGQAQKREAMEEVCRKFNVPLEMVVYIGDSQTDVECVRALQGRGLSVMFNGKGRVCRSSDLMYIGDDARYIGGIIVLFEILGREKLLNFHSTPIEVMRGLIATVTSENIEELERKSVIQRKKLRGIHIGGLS